MSRHFHTTRADRIAADIARQKNAEFLAAIAAPAAVDVGAAQAETAQAAATWCQCPACAPVLHASDCAVHNAPALPVGPCDCCAAPGLVPLPATATKEMRVAAVKFANGDAVYKNVAAGALEIEEQIYGETWEAMVSAFSGAKP